MLGSSRYIYAVSRTARSARPIVAWIEHELGIAMTTGGFEGCWELENSLPDTTVSSIDELYFFFFSLLFLFQNVGSRRFCLRQLHVGLAMGITSYCNALQVGSSQLYSTLSYACSVCYQVAVRSRWRETLTCKLRVASFVPNDEYLR